MSELVFVGLGNPGTKFQGTRHNLGIDVLISWTKEQSTEKWTERDGIKELHLDIAAATGDTKGIACIFPLTFMNNVGPAVAAYLQAKSLDVSSLIVVHDDIELDPGEVRVTTGGSAKGHNGVRSLQAALGTSDFTRLRLGIGRPPRESSEPVDAYVLSRFTVDDAEWLESMYVKAKQELNALVATEN